MAASCHRCSTRSHLVDEQRLPPIIHEPIGVGRSSGNLVGGFKHFFIFHFIYPIGSMYAIYGNIYHQYTPNVSIYTIHSYIDPIGYGIILPIDESSIIFFKMVGSHQPVMDHAIAGTSTCTWHAQFAGEVWPVRRCVANRNPWWRQVVFW